MVTWPSFLQKNALQTFQLIRFATTLFIGILLAKVFGLSTGAIAVYEILLFLGNFFTFFWISAGVKTALSEYGRSRFPNIVIVQLAFLLFGFSSLAGGILYFFRNFIVHYFTTFEQLDYIGLLSLYIVFNAPATLIEYIYLVQKKFQAILYYGVIVHSGQLIAIVLPLSLDWGIGGIFQCLLVWALLKFAWLLFCLGKIIRPIPSDTLFQWSILKRLLVLIFPLSLHMLIGGGMEYVDGFIVSSYFEDNGMFAIFRYGARELPLVTILASALTASFIPLAVENQTTVLPKLKSAVTNLSNWLYPLSMLLMLISPSIFPLIYNQQFAPAAAVFNIYLLIISSRLLLPQVIIYAQQENYFLVKSAIIEVIINLFLSLYLVEDYGLEGIAFATVIAYFINKLLLILYVYFKLNVPLSDYLDIKKYSIYNLLLFGCWFYT